MMGSGSARRQRVAWFRSPLGIAKAENDALRRQLSTKSSPLTVPPTTHSTAGCGVPGAPAAWLAPLVLAVLAFSGRRRPARPASVRLRPWEP